MRWFKTKPSWEEHYAQTLYDAFVASGGPGEITALKLRIPTEGEFTEGHELDRKWRVRVP